MRTKSVRIEVTQGMINRGKLGSLFRCPIALAFQKATGIRGVEVTADIIYYHLGVGELRTSLPKRAQSFIMDFDADKPVAPFIFTLKIPKKALKALG